MKKVVIDAGHGGIDSGASAGGVREKDITLKIVKLIEGELVNYDVKAIYTRSSDTYPSLSERVEIANRNKTDLFVSVHVNSATNKTANGYETLVYLGLGRSRQGAIFHKHLSTVNKAYGKKDRGIKEQDVQVLRATKMPAVLTENLFVSNEYERKLLLDDKYLQLVAKAHIDAIVEFLSLKKKTSIENYKIKTGDTLYSIAKNHKTTVNAIQKRNNIKNASLIRAGKVLKIKRGEK
ncbi:endolysin [Bacillus phage vB_Bpu_PumA1]|uniref:Endolysin n=1 Tax=Bacillus phage vB_Bpu_PumA1 TaxID=2662127 RepID=A0A5Q2WD79_9CAUD|nr:endolysin [Bacillus phage vB_Bpu_PumA1]QGH74214.1 endolysin [Bacillus phage vB_Bpu_PumA1]